MNPYTQAVISGLMTGATYTLLGMGLVLVFRTSRILNLAHGETFVVAAVTVVLLTGAKVPLWASLATAVLTTILFYTGLHRFVLRQRSHWPQGTLILITLGAAFLMRGLMILLIGTDPASFAPLFAGPPIRFAGGAMPPQGIALVLIGFGVSIAVGFFLARTRRGKELLATAENPQAAELLGVNVENARLLAYGISGALGAISAILLVPLISIDFQSGLAMTMRGFIAAAISGMSPMRTVASGFALGIFESMVGAVLGALFQDPVIFCVLILVAVWQSRKIRFGGGQRA